MSDLVVHGLNGLAFAMLLFLMAAGLSLVFGLMGIVNLAHGSLYLLGAYVGITVVAATRNFALGLVAAAVAGALFGGLLQRVFLSRYTDQPLMQVLFTFGVLLAVGDVALWIWGGVPQVLGRPEFLAGGVPIGQRTFPTYRLFVIAAGAVTALLLWLVIGLTRVGAIVRAGLDDPQMVGGVGINLSRVQTLVFALGATLAAAAGVLGAPFLGIAPGTDLEIVLFSFAVVVIGGLGTLQGALLGALVVGLVDSFAKVLVPNLAMFTLFLPMVLILAVRPQGLLGR